MCVCVLWGAGRGVASRTSGEDAACIRADQKKASNSRFNKRVGWRNGVDDVVAFKAPKSAGCNNRLAYTARLFGTQGKAIALPRAHSICARVGKHEPGTRGVNRRG